MSKMKERMKKKAQQNKQNSQQSESKPDLNSDNLASYNKNKN